MTAPHDDTFWPDGTFKTKHNAFNINFKPFRDDDVQTLDRTTRNALRATRNVERKRAEDEHASLSHLSAPGYGARYSPPVVGREPGEKQRDRTAAIKRAGMTATVKRGDI